MFCAACTCTILATKALGCFCFSAPMCYRVEGFSEFSAVFVGRVVDVWPSRQTLIKDSQHLPLTALKHRILRRWHGALSTEEEQDTVRPRTEESSNTDMRACNVSGSWSLKFWRDQIFGKCTRMHPVAGIVSNRAGTT